MCSLTLHTFSLISKDLVDMSTSFAASSLNSLEKVGASALETLKDELGGIVGDQYGVPDDEETDIEIVVRFLAPPFSNVPKQ